MTHHQVTREGEQLAALHRRAFPSKAHRVVIADAVDLRPRELAIIAVMATLVLAAGFYPNAVLELTRPASEDWISRLVIDRSAARERQGSRRRQRLTLSFLLLAIW